MMSDEIPTKRKYELKQRAAEMAETRLRITEAAVELHGTIGPARTTVSAIAERAGVQRHTVYRHFPTDADLFGACSAHYIAANPLPDQAPWRAIADPQRRLARALDDLYAYYERTEPMFSKSFATSSSSTPSLPSSCRAGPIWPKPPRPSRPAGRPEGADGVSSKQRCAMRSTSRHGARSRRTAASPGPRPSSSQWRSSRPPPSGRAELDLGRQL